jgi:anaerobic dimethyl sulfoxide reductase subunit B (iron-sulfur subunit)
MTYAFIFDASSCSGCKACQAACKDKNQLPTGVLWRRVYEVSGGGWERHGEAWTNIVFAYNLSIACNHCEHPKCAGVCPVDAYVIRPDGIVYIDESKCVGCGYCAWACPYEAPQYNPDLGHMTKCNFCFDNIDAGAPPACVAACPMRVLGVEEIREQAIESREQRVESSGGKGEMELWKVSAEKHPFPLPKYSRTQPHLAIKPHAAMSVTEAKQVANHEEIHPRKESAWEEAPLVIFTLLAQMAVGGFWMMQLMLQDVWNLAVGNQIILRAIPLLVIGAALGLGMFFSFAHLGTKKNAWRTLGHLRKSWLSREILFESLFSLSWLAVTAELLLLHRTTPALMWVTALFGYFLIHSMSNVYRLPAKPAWNSWRTNASFFVSTLVLGWMSMSAVLNFESQQIVIDLSFWQMIGTDIFIVALILISLQTIISSKFHPDGMTRALHITVNFLAVFATFLAFMVIGKPSLEQTLIVFVLVLTGEVIGRWQFYKAAS